MNGYARAAIALTLLWSPLSLSAQDTELNRYTLEDLEGVFVRTTAMESCEALGVTTSAVRATAETALIESDVTLLTEAEMLALPALPELRIELECVGSEGAAEGPVAFSVSTRLMQAAQLIRDEQITLAEAVTWYTSSIGVTESAAIQAALEGAASQTVQAFVSAYQAINAEAADTGQVREMASGPVPAPREIFQVSGGGPATDGRGAGPNNPAKPEHF